MPLWRRKDGVDFTDEGRAARLRAGEAAADFESWVDADTPPGEGPAPAAEAPPPPPPPPPPPAPSGPPLWVWTPTGALFTDEACKTAIASGRLRAADFCRQSAEPAPAPAPEPAPEPAIEEPPAGPVVEEPAPPPRRRRG